MTVAAETIETKKRLPEILQKPGVVILLSSIKTQSTNTNGDQT